MKEEGHVKTKIVSDSTLRYVNPLGLKTDVMCMSGGGLGQIAQAVIDDPDTATHDNIVIVAGANDMKMEVFENDEHYVNSITKSLDKVHDFAVKNAEKNIVLAKSQRRSDRMEDEEVNEEDVITKMVREDFLHWKIDNLVDQMAKDFEDKTNVTSVDLFYEMDDTGHPKKDNTSIILNAIQDHSPPLPGDLIWEEEFTTADFIYKDVQSIYRYGCNCCGRFGQGRKGKHPLVCEECMKDVTGTVPNHDLTALQNIRKYVTDAFKETGGKKRAHEEEERGEDDDEDSKKTKLTGNSQDGVQQ